jgi:hypothetical protein
LWYQRVFSGRTLADLEQTTLASIIERNTTISNLQSNVFVLSAEVNGQVYVDGNANGRQDRVEQGIPGVEMHLLNDEGVVLATTRTGRDGRYRFASFAETGDYTVRIVPPARLTVANTDRAVLISRGGLTVGNVNFGLRNGTRSALANSVADKEAPSSAATDAAIATMHVNPFPTLSGSRTSRSRFGRISHLG